MARWFRSAASKEVGGISYRAVGAFFITMAMCFLLVGAVVVNRSRVELLTMEQLILEKSTKISDVITKLLYKTQVISSLILQNNGEPESFEQIAATILDDPSILNLLIAPGGVVSGVYPMEGNEAVLGLDFFSDGDGNKEALLARETRELVLGGPFTSVQGQQVLVGRLPVFIDEPGGERFWGLVSVTLKYPQALEGAGLSELQIQGFAYEIWRLSPDTNENQSISSSGHNYKKNTRYVERNIQILNADWYFRILPVRTWYEFPETWISAFIGICVSLLIAAVVQNNQDLKRLKDKLEILSNTDSLTGIYNRRYFMNTAAAQIDLGAGINSEAYIILFDLDYFKKINDEHRHRVGDMVLKELCARVVGTLRFSDLFARYGGEEFILFVSDIDKPSVMSFAERIRRIIAETPVAADALSLTVTASFGVAPVLSVNSLDEAIAQADEALYRAKDAGRNRVIFFENKTGIEIIPRFMV